MAAAEIWLSKRLDLDCGEESKVFTVFVARKIYSWQFYNRLPDFDKSAVLNESIYFAVFIILQEEGKTTGAWF